MTVFLPDQAGPVRNISNCSLPPFAFNLLIISVVSFDDWLPTVWYRQVNNVVFESSPSFTRPRIMVHAIISYALGVDYVSHFWNCMFARIDFYLFPCWKRTIFCFRLGCFLQLELLFQTYQLVYFNQYYFFKHTIWYGITCTLFRVYR